MEDRLRELLHADRAATKARGHDWDVADVVAVVKQWLEETWAEVESERET